MVAYTEKGSCTAWIQTPALANCSLWPVDSTAAASLPLRSVLSCAGLGRLGLAELCGAGAAELS
jgi:hypothetical protein